jgi:plastocyanin
MTGSTTVTITFPMGTSLVYTPACIKVKKGTMVTFNGDFTLHPLGGGNSPPTVDTTSPITATSTGMTATFNIANAGSFGFFCEFHQSLGMKGAIFSQ